MSEHMHIHSPYTFTEKEHPVVCLRQRFVDYGHTIAIRDEHDGTVLRYDELLSLWAAYQRYLNSSVLTPGNRIAIHCSKNLHYIPAFLAALSLDLTVVPLLSEHPHQRKLQCLKDASVVLVLGDPIPDMACPHRGFLETVQMEAIPELRSIYDHPAYCIFTSGSTGMPAGVLVPPDGLLSVIDTQAHLFEVSSSSRCLWYYEHSFDASLSDIFVPLYSGAELIIPKASSLETPEAFYTLVARYALTHADIPPSFLSLLNPHGLPACLKVLILGGEACPEEVLKQHSSRRLINVYGPTETSICSSLTMVTPDSGQAPLGLPVANMHYLLVPESDSDLYELHIQGKGVALGYLNEERPGSFYEIDGVRTYASGDLVRLHDGHLYFHGRKDRQVQIHGHRVDICEVEHALQLLYPDVPSLITVHSHPQQGTHLVAHVCTDHEIARGDMTRRMQEYLPAYACPSSVLLYQHWPTNENGKIDRLYLHQCAEQKLSEDQRSMTYVLQRAEENPTASIFDLGLNSLQTLTLLSQLQEAGYTVSLHDLYSKPLHQALQNVDREQSFFCSFESLHGEIELSEKPLPLLPKRHQALQAVFMTGCTGFLGRQLLLSLVRSGIHVHCLIRAHDRRHAETRLHALLPEEHHQLLTAYAGDCSIPDFGLTEEEQATLASSADAVLHGASDVSILQDAFAGHEKRMATVSTLIRLAKTRQLPLYTISTLALFVGGDRAPSVITEESSLSTASGLYGGYTQHKYLEERALHQAALSHEVPFAVIRPGLLISDEQNENPPSHDHVYKALYYLVSSGIYPNEALEVACDCTPVSLAADLIAEKIRSAAPQPVLHIANPKTLQLRTMVQFLRDCGYCLTGVDQSQWEHQMKHAEVPLPQLFCRTLGQKQYDSMRAFDLFLCSRSTFQAGRELSTLLGAIQRSFPTPYDCLKPYMAHLPRPSMTGAGGRSYVNIA